jgi:hypothetical protein
MLTRFEEERKMEIQVEQIGGAYVRRLFQCGARQVKAGDQLSAAEVKAMPAANRRALERLKYIDVFHRDGDLAEQNRKLRERVDELEARLKRK